ncbi:putative 1-acyl-sn-glycerol-3-phosphate acyltransferase 4 [Astathelohania contejeani]|uniref:1-acyl-sn-glycerol-3-phosphate acyltransferase 4 n=1 Tax=Astathelohania contejeani TaxID=164912 RepID=A0ABQ7HVT3_9MICR|nr:putative 1-acyl-sn-glycerol-3-phosphate acyltransferase 4 [Thelohania contejeani]
MFLTRIFIFLAVIPIALLSVLLPIFNIPLCLINKKYAIKLTSFFSYTIWSLFNLILLDRVDLEIETEDLSIQSGENTIVISNHIGAMDFLILNHIASKYKMIAHMKYVLKESIRYIPIFGWNLGFLGFLFLKRAFLHDSERIIKWLRFMKYEQIPMWLVLYPEGSRYTFKKQEESIKYCKKIRETPLANLLWPRTKGFELCYQELRGYISKIVDVTVYCPNTPSLFFVFFGWSNIKIKAKVRCINIKDIKNTPKEYLIALFKEKDMQIKKWKSQL